jgi:hypothetical protein
MPRNWDDLVSRDRGAACHLRDDLAADLTRLTEEGYEAISCQTCDGHTAVYRLRKGADQCPG